MISQLEWHLMINEVVKEREGTLCRAFSFRFKAITPQSLCSKPKQNNDMAMFMVALRSFLYANRANLE